MDDDDDADVDEEEDVAEGEDTDTDSSEAERKPKPIDGVEIETLRPGDTVNFPKIGMTVRIHYVLTLNDDHTVIDSSRERMQPFFFHLGMGEVIPGLDQAIFRMSRGQVCKITVAPRKAYGENGFVPVIPPNATLIYEVEMVAFAPAKKEAVAEKAEKTQSRGAAASSAKK